MFNNKPQIRLCTNFDNIRNYTGDYKWFQSNAAKAGDYYFLLTNKFYVLCSLEVNFRTHGDFNLHKALRTRCFEK